MPRDGLYIVVWTNFNVDYSEGDQMKKLTNVLSVMLVALPLSASAVDCGGLSQAVQQVQTSARSAVINDITRHYDEINAVSDAVKSVCLDNLSAIPTYSGLAAKIAIKTANKLCEVAAQKASAELARVRNIATSNISNLTGPLNNIGGQLGGQILNGNGGQILNGVGGQVINGIGGQVNGIGGQVVNGIGNNVTGAVNGAVNGAINNGVNNVINQVAPPPQPVFQRPQAPQTPPAQPQTPQPVSNWAKLKGLFGG